MQGIYNMRYRHWSEMASHKGEMLQVAGGARSGAPSSNCVVDESVELGGRVQGGAIRHCQRPSEHGANLHRASTLKRQEQRCPAKWLYDVTQSCVSDASGITALGGEWSSVAAPRSS